LSSKYGCAKEKGSLSVRLFGCFTAHQQFQIFKQNRKQSHVYKVHIKETNQSVDYIAHTSFYLTSSNTWY